MKIFSKKLKSFCFCYISSLLQVGFSPQLLCRALTHLRFYDRTLSPWRWFSGGPYQNLQVGRRIIALISRNNNNYNRVMTHITGRARDICGSPNSWIPMHVSSSTCINNKGYRTIKLQQAVSPERIDGPAHQVTCFCTPAF